MPNPIADAHPLCRMTAAELTSLYRRRELSPTEAVRTVLDRAESVNALFGAFVHIDHDGATAAAKASEARWAKAQPSGPLDGIPTTIKDLVSVKTWPLRMGSWTTPSDPVEEDAPSVQSLRDAGAVLIGSTSTPEFGWKVVADSPLSGITRNPWNPALTPGGSSGGAAVAAATGAGVLHLGSDGGGSIRIPAAFTGVVGHKPSFGRVPYFPPSAFGTLGHLGPITRTVEDAALMLDVMSRRNMRDWHQNPLTFSAVGPLSNHTWSGLRVGLWTEPPTGAVDPEIIAAAIDAASTIATLGASVEPITLPGANLLSVFNVLWFTGAAHRVHRIPSELHHNVDPGLLRIAEIGASYSAIEYADATAQRAVFGIAMDMLLDSYDLVISPSTSISAFSIGHDVPPASGLSFWTEWAGFSFPLNLSQQPACSVPMGFTKVGLPIGLQITGAKGEDARVLAAAAALMAARSSQG